MPNFLPELRILLIIFQTTRFVCSEKKKLTSFKRNNNERIELQGDPFDLSQVQAFILNKFVSARRNVQQILYHHFTTAVDSENMNKVFGAVKDFILQKHLENLMLQ